MSYNRHSPLLDLPFIQGCVWSGWDQTQTSICCDSDSDTYVKFNPDLTTSSFTFAQSSRSEEIITLSGNRRKKYRKFKHLKEARNRFVCSSSKETENRSYSMNTSFCVQEHYPKIYKISLDEKQDLESTFRDIFEGVAVVDVHHRLGEYVTSVIEPTDWAGIWRTTVSVNGSPLKCDFQVDVIDVTHNSVDAVVILRKLLSPAVTQLTTDQFDAIDDFMTEEKVKTIKLTDVWVISAGDETEQRLLQTAIVIEQSRWFYQYIWRPWDDLSDSSGENELFLDSRFDTRFKLYQDMIRKNVSQSFIKKFNMLLKESKSLKEKLDSIKMSIASRDKSSSSGDENNMESEELIDETDIISAMRLEMRIRDNQREVEMMENPFTRIIANSHSTVSEEDEEEGREGNKIHVVSKVVCLTQLQTVSEKIVQMKNQETPIVFHKTLAKALKAGQTGDKILILPGNYVCQSLPWIDYDVEIIGLSKDASSVVLTASESIGDIFLNCCSQCIRISNITFKTLSDTQSVITVHSGVTDLMNCIVDGGKSARNTLVALSKADVAIDNCKIISDSPSKGIVKKPGGSVSVNGEVVEEEEDVDECSEHSRETRGKKKRSGYHESGMNGHRRSSKEDKIINSIDSNAGRRSK